ncbi:bifunctional 4-hydroxy-2-oxoglutarate aldolase/2-dehydro-3-deoxy-phosphogluconate aldolase [Pedobacter psychroterrae]|uniref:Bifunctional 4-hydroxy-2-oxoglutarate aldolase/2-dehydro-3-deoxy-phosphogluconate aldolase n=1 Tax=Pedobacter psychroterrae TaxID=2530453 RepID=A0A4R0N9V8_9SPHI|nr:bifunctional 4-hydroxy-2-oxoglutarate aldolase/2-dehydro-3-deoxy-phosphogluconate aldolase [Pedobacter psychroterrae]TCC96865.1 bifunctional 4-hydroxy-2-oxoglutarate aldolase/2-dehydro-3-deoxy-phosphogluconate aldolase [Pedobacter psychroterrae]
MKTKTIAHIESAKVVAIIRSDNEKDVRPMLANLIASGITALEITANTPGFCAHILWVKREFPEILVGAGTITTVELAKQAIGAGAQFLVTPNMNADVIGAAKNAGVVSLMGAMTPTEIATGLQQGADFIKLFPAGTLGTDYLKAVLAPFRGCKIIAVGGINAANAAEWLQAGAVGIGVGGTFTTGSKSEIKQSVAALLAQIK